MRTLMSAVAAVGLLVSTSVYADTFVELSAQASATGSGLPSIPPVVSNNQQYINESLTDQGDANNLQTLGASASNQWGFDNPSSEAFVFAQSTSVQTAAFADYGALGASATATSILQVGSFKIVEPSGSSIVLFNPNTTGGQGIASVDFTDPITPTTDGSETFTMYLENATLSDSVPAVQCVRDNLIDSNLDIGAGGGELSINDVPCQPSPISSISETIPVYAGELIPIDEDLLVEAGSGVPTPVDGSDVQTVTAEAIDTSYLTIDGAPYTSASGTVYLTELPIGQVPEPSSLAILSVSLIGVGWAFRKSSPLAAVGHCSSRYLEQN